MTNNNVKLNKEVETNFLVASFIFLEPDHSSPSTGKTFFAKNLHHYYSKKQMDPKESVFIIDHLHVLPTFRFNQMLTQHPIENEKYIQFMVLDRYLSMVKETVYMKEMKRVDIENYPQIHSDLMKFFKKFPEKYPQKYLERPKVQWNLSKLMQMFCCSLKFRKIQKFKNSEENYQKLKENAEILLNSFPYLIYLDKIFFEGNFCCRKLDNNGDSIVNTYTLLELPEIGTLIEECFDNFITAHDQNNSVIEWTKNEKLIEIDDFISDDDSEDESDSTIIDEKIFWEDSINPKPTVIVEKRYKNDDSEKDENKVLLKTKINF